jgi:2-(1,2-epoxy-1,2-dihydrophenyl)acetyl-CoA isomerase
MTDYAHILFDEADGLVTITINRPEVLNALAVQTLEELIHAVDRVRDEGTARALLLTGTGRAFCSGADLSAGSVQKLSGMRDAGAALETHFNPLLQRLRHLPVPLVVAVNGVAAGGGCGYALAGDIVIAGKSAYFLQPFANIGLVPDVGATWALPRLIGRARATAMMMLGERVHAQQAAEWGLIYQAVEDAELMEAARGIALKLAAGPTRTYGLMRQGIADCLEMGLTDALARERRDQCIAGRTADHLEGVAAFREKRKPQFRGA